MPLPSRKELFTKLRAAGCEPLRKGSDGRTKTRRDLAAELDAATKRASAVARAIVTQNKADRATVRAEVLTTTAKPTHPALALSAELDQAWEEYNSAPDAWTRKKVFEQHRSLIMNTGKIRKSAKAAKQNSKTN